MDKTLHEADRRFRAEAFRLRLREDLVSMRIRHLRRGKPSEADLGSLLEIHREAMGHLAELVRLQSPAAPCLPAAPKGLEDTSVEVVAYDPTWPVQFEAEAVQIRGTLGTQAAGVHHVGSTAVPGLPAKPIIDIAAAIEPAALRYNLPECIGAMKAIGYDYYGDWGHHGGHYFAKTAGTLRTSSAQLHAADSEDLAELLAFRDAARSDPSLVGQYAELKVALARALSRDRSLYVWYKGHWLADRLLGGHDALTWGTRFLRAQYPTLVQLGFRGFLARLRPRFAGRGLHPMALRTPRPSGA